MSIKIMAAVFESETLGPTERLIMLSLADHADDSGRCYPSISRLCSRTGLSERAVRTNIRTLEKGGYLSIAIGAGQGGANVYIVTATPAADAPRQEMPPGSRCPTPRQEMPVRGAADAPKPSLTINEPSEEPPLVPPKAEAKRRRSAIPANWQPNETNIEHATAQGFSEKEIEDETNRFRDHHHAKGTLFADFDAA